MLRAHCACLLWFPMALRAPKVRSVPVGSSQCCAGGTRHRLSRASAEGGLCEICSGGGDELGVGVRTWISGKSAGWRSYIRRRIHSILGLRLICTCRMYARVRVFHLFVLVQFPIIRRFLRGLRHGLRGVIPAEQTQRRESCCHDEVEPDPR